MTKRVHPGSQAVVALMQDAWKLLESDEWSKALDLFNRVLQLEPLNEGAMQGRISAVRKLGDFDEADRLLRLGLDTYCDSVGILSERAWLALDRKQYDLAICAFEAVLAIKKTDEGLFVWQISLLRQQERFDEAEKLLDEALSRFGASESLGCERGWLYFYYSRVEEAMDSFTAVVERNPEHESATQGQLACLRTLGRYLEATNRGKRAADRFPKNTGIQSEVGWLYFEQALFAKATEAFEIVLKLAPKDPCVHINLAWSLIREGDRESLAKATMHCRAALILQPTFSEAMGCLGVAAFKQGRIVEAERQLRRSIGADPRRGHYSDLGALYVQMARYEEAETVLKDGATRKPADAAIYLELGNLYLQTDRLKEAMTQFRHAQAIDPTHPDPPRALAVTFMESEKLADAEGVLRVALKRLDDSKRWRLHLTLCQVLTRVGEETGDATLFEEAMKEVQSAIRMRPEHPEPHFSAGIVRCKLGDYYGSLKCFKRCLKADKDRAEAEINVRRVKALIRQDKALSRVSRWAGFFVASVAVAQLCLLWVARWLGSKQEKTAIVSEKMFTILVPICLGILVVSVLLPWLSKLKMTGLEAELSQPKPKEALTSGPKGEIGFGNSSRAFGLAVI